MGRITHITRHANATPSLRPSRPTKGHRSPPLFPVAVRIRLKTGAEGFVRTRYFKPPVSGETGGFQRIGHDHHSVRRASPIRKRTQAERARSLP